eukprot:1142692-Pelagomonas_calceolata.AAC.1
MHSPSKHFAKLSPARTCSMPIRRCLLLVCGLQAGVCCGFFALTFAKPHAKCSPGSNRSMPIRRCLLLACGLQAGGCCGLFALTFAKPHAQCSPGSNRSILICRCLLHVRDLQVRGCRGLGPQQLLPAGHRQGRRAEQPGVDSHKGRCSGNQGCIACVYVCVGVGVCLRALVSSTAHQKTGLPAEQPHAGAHQDLCLQKQRVGVTCVLC